MLALLVDRNVLHFALSSGSGTTFCVARAVLIVLTDYILLTVVLPMFSLPVFNKLNECGV